MIHYSSTKVISNSSYKGLKSIDKIPFRLSLLVLTRSVISFIPNYSQVKVKPSEIENQLENILSQASLLLNNKEIATSLFDLIRDQDEYMIDILNDLLIIYVYINSDPR